MAAGQSRETARSESTATPSAPGSRDGPYDFSDKGRLNRDSVQAVKDGTMTATLGVDLTSAGKLLVDQIPDIIKAGDAWQPKSFIPGYTIVSKDNVDQILKSNPQ